jgi:Transposase.
MNELTLCVGADVHLDEIVLRAVDKTDGHEVLERFHVTNNLPGAQSVATTLAQAAAQHGYTRLEIGWEATGLLWVPFHRFLDTSPLLRPFTPELVCFNPKLVANFKDGMVLRRPKNDERDAWDIAARVRFGEWPVSYVPADFWQGLRRLTRYRYQLARNLSREEMRFQSYAFLKASDWKRVKPFSTVFGATSIALLTEFTIAELTAMSHDQLVDLITHRGHGRFDDPTATARARARGTARLLPH